jgi:hypothetical protein
MFCNQASARRGLSVLLVFFASAASVHAQDPASLLRSLGRVIEATTSKQGQPHQPKQTQPADETAGEDGASRPQVASPAAPSQLLAQPTQPAASQRTIPPQDEGIAIYEKAKAEGRSDEEAWIYQQLTGYVRQLHEAAAGANQLAFKNLRVGAEFPMNISGTGMPSATGRNVTSLSEGTAPEMNRPKPKQGSTEIWRCWSQTWGMGIQCLLIESPELTSAFGEDLRSVEITLTKPQYDYQPLQYSWQKDMHPRIAVIHIVADGAQFAKAANDYARGVFRTAPKVARSKNENGATPTRAACAAVNAKRVADLTTNDLALRRACANPTTGLFQAMETPETLYKYENANVAVDVAERELIDGSVQSSMTIGSSGFNTLMEKRSERVQTLRSQYAGKKAKAAQKDF